MGKSGRGLPGFALVDILLVSGACSGKEQRQTGVETESDAGQPTPNTLQILVKNTGTPSSIG